MNPFLRTTAWVGALAASLVGLVAAGGRLPGPPLVDPSATWSWLATTEPATAAFSLLRLAAIVVVGYLLLVTVVLLGASATHVRVLIAASTRLTVPAARRLVRHAVGAGFALGVATSTGTMVAGAQVTPTSPTTTVTATPSDPPPVLRIVGDDLVLVHLGPAPADTGPVATDTPVGPAPDAPGAADDLPRPPPGPLSPMSPGAPDPPAAASPSTTRVSSEPEPGPGPTAPSPEPEPERPPTPPVDVGASSPARPAAGDAKATAADAAPADDAPVDVAVADHRVVTGDHLWGIAERTLAAAWGRDPGPHEVAPYLQRLIAANRSVLAVPDDPDLVFPGQVFALPPVSAR